MSGSITFVGAGPGAPDLITLRGAAALRDADLVIYAGSLVNEELLELAPNARLVNSAKLALPEVLREMREAYEQGGHVVRLHTGDPAIYGAVSEQFRELDRLGIPYSVVPGVSSAFAAAAALKVELTMPGLSQSVILTRDAGRTPVPKKEALDQLAAHGSTMCIFLSVGEMESLVKKLLSAGRSPSTPAAVVYRASWPNEQIVRGTLSDIAQKVADAGIQRQSMIVIGEVLERNGDLSKLYDESFSHGYRRGGRCGAGFSGKVALFALTRKAACKAAEIAAGLHDAVIFVPEKYASAVPAARRRSFPEGGFSAVFADSWKQFDAFVMVMAAGIVVRHAAQLCKDKLHDPAVVVCDEAGQYAISLLSGHFGGANRLAAEVARITGGKAVITTASDVNHLLAFDEFAARCHYRLVSKEPLAELAAARLDGEAFDLFMPQELFQRWFADQPGFRLAGGAPEPGAILIRRVANGTELRLVKRKTALGVGCRKGVPAERIHEVVLDVLDTHQLTLGELDVIASAELKSNEPGLLEFARSAGKELRFFSADELNQIPVPTPSAAAEQHLGLHSVSEAAALLAAGPDARILVPKQSRSDVTAAVAMEVDHV